MLNQGATELQIRLALINKENYATSKRKPLSDQQFTSRRKEGYLLSQNDLVGAFRERYVKLVYPFTNTTKMTIEDNNLLEYCLLAYSNTDIGSINKSSGLSNTANALSNLKWEPTNGTPLAVHLLTVVLPIIRSEYLGNATASPKLISCQHWSNYMANYKTLFRCALGPNENDILTMFMLRQTNKRLIPQIRQFTNEMSICYDLENLSLATSMPWDRLVQWAQHKLATIKQGQRSFTEYVELVKCCIHLSIGFDKPLEDSSIPRSWSLLWSQAFVNGIEEPIQLKHLLIKKLHNQEFASLQNAILLLIDTSLEEYRNLPNLNYALEAENLLLKQSDIRTLDLEEKMTSKSANHNGEHDINVFSLYGFHSGSSNPTYEQDSQAMLSDYQKAWQLRFD